MKTTCPECAAETPLWRIFLYWTGVHIRCRGCGRVYRLVATIGGLFAVMTVFVAVYLVAFWALLDLRWPSFDSPRNAAIWSAAVPALPAVAVTVLTIWWIHRRAPDVPDDPQRLHAGAFAFVYTAATVVAVALAALGVSGIVLTRYGERLPSVDVVEVAPVDVPEAAAREFVFVDLKGVERNLAELRGSPVLLHLFRFDAPGARATLETIRELRKTAVDDDFVFVLVARADAESLHAFATSGVPTLPYVRTAAPWPAVFGPEPPDGQVTIVLDRDGRVVGRHAGAADWASDSARGFLSRVGRG